MQIPCGEGVPGQPYGALWRECRVFSVLPDLWVKSHILLGMLQHRGVQQLAQGHTAAWAGF